MNARAASTKPVTFDWQIAGHAAVRRFLEQSLQRNQLAHAICFYGPRQLGKATTAHRLAQILLCRDSRQRPCGQCPDCRMIKQGNHPDCHLVGLTPGQASIGVDEIRHGLLDKLSLSSLTGGRQVAILDDADQLTPAAANSLLKTLEEPSNNVILLLIVEKLANVPATILSRCQTVRFSSVDDAAMAEFAASLTGDRSERDFATRLANGRPGRAQQMIGDAAAQQTYRQTVETCLRLIDQPVAERFAVADELTKQDDPVLAARQAMAVWQTCCRDLVLTSLGLETAVTNEFALRSYRRLLRHAGAHRWLRALEAALQAEELLAHHTPPKVVLDTFFLQLP